MVVFGSVARGDVTKWSDIDVLVVAEGCASTPMQRHAHLDNADAHLAAVTIQRDRNRRVAPSSPAGGELPGTAAARG